MGRRLFAHRRDIRFPPINRRRAGVPPENFRLKNIACSGSLSESYGGPRSKSYGGATTFCSSARHPFYANKSAARRSTAREFPLEKYSLRRPVFGILRRPAFEILRRGDNFLLIDTLSARHPFYANKSAACWSLAGEFPLEKYNHQATATRVRNPTAARVRNPTAGRQFFACRHSIGATSVLCL